MTTNRTVKRIAFAALILTGGFLLSGCIKNITPLPKEERYQYINQMEEKLDLSTAGEVGKKTYDEGDGVFTSSYMRTSITSVEAYPIIKERLMNLAVNQQCKEKTNQLSMLCGIGKINVEIGRASTEAEAMYIKIIDHNSGRYEN